jgi:malate synthase
MATSSVNLEDKLNDSLKAQGIETGGPLTEAYAEILTPEAMTFLAKLAREFEDRRRTLLEKRKARQQEINQGKLPDFLKETVEIRAKDWTVAPIPTDLQDRPVEITGPIERKMIINALNSMANVFMGDFEDSHTPTWQNNIEGHINLRDAVKRVISFASPEGKRYTLAEKTATLMVRARGLHLLEKHLYVDGKTISG